MSEVSSLIAAPLWAYLRQHQVDASEPQRQQQTRRAIFGLERIDWRSFSQLCQLAAAQDQRSGDLRDALERALGALPLGAGLHLLGWTTTPHQLYAQSIRWLLPTLMPAVTITARQLDETRIEVVAGLVEGADDCEPFFVLLGHLWGALPGLLQLPKALIDAEVGPRRGQYTITAPPALRLPRRLLAPRDGLGRAWAVAAGLHTQLGQARAELGMLRALTDGKALAEQQLNAALDEERRAAAALRDAASQQEQLAAQAASSARAHAEASASLRADVESLRAKLATALTASAAAAQAASEREAALQATVAQLEAAQERDDAAIAALRAERDHIIQDRESFERLAAETKTRLDHTLSKLAEVDAQRRLAENTLGAAVEEVAGLKAALQAAQADTASAHDAASAAQAALAETQAALKTSQTTLKTTQAALQAAQTSLKATQTELDAAQAALDAALAAAAQAQEARAEALADGARWEQLVALILADARAELRAPVEQLQLLGRAVADSAEDRDALSQRLQRLAGELRLRVSHLFDLERIYTGRLALDEPQPLKATQLLDELTSVLAPDMEARGNTLVMEATRGIQEMRLDAPKLRKALHHLLLNAGALSEQSAVRLKLSRDRKPGTRFELRYQGDPLPLDQWEQTLARPDDPASPAALPSAVRHTIARALIEALGGAITVKDTADQEQSLSFVLPDANE